MRNEAIKNLYPKVATICGGKYCFDAEGNEVEIDDSKVKIELDKLEAKFKANQYQRDRKAEYPDWGTQLNKIYDDGIDKWKSEMVDPIKAKYPKPS